MDLTLNDALLVSDQHSQMVGAVQAALVLWTFKKHFRFFSERDRLRPNTVIVCTAGAEVKRPVFQFRYFLNLSQDCEYELKTETNVYT